ncbi:MAG: hypothetical protein KGI71_05755 [Patescibacteria group bacterium]|nr:hypothetical protein [Patescibacteria group bacterium]
MGGDYLNPVEWHGRYIAEAGLDFLEKYGHKDTETYRTIRQLVDQYDYVEKLFEERRALVEFVEWRRENGAPADAEFMKWIHESYGLDDPTKVY